VVAAEIGDSYGSVVISGIERYLREKNFFFLTMVHRHDKKLLESYSRLLLERGIEGLITIDTSVTERLPLPVVAVAGHRAVQGVTNIIIDHRTAALSALRHLTELGHRRIAFLKGPVYSSDTEDRWKNIVQVAGELGIRIHSDLIVELNDPEARAALAPEYGYPFAKELLARKRPFTALFAYNDNAAIAAMRVFQDAGLRVPQDVSVVGFDDIHVAAYTDPTLTTVRQPLEKMGRIAASTILDLIENRGKDIPEIAIEPQFVVRQSTGPVPGTSRNSSVQELVLPRYPAPLRRLHRDESPSTQLRSAAALSARETVGPVRSGLQEKHGIHLIAQLANVSIGTVDRALHGRREINETTRELILQIAQQIGYSPNLAARALSVARTGARIGVCIPKEIHFFYDQLWGGVLDEAQRLEQLGVQLENRRVQNLGEGDKEAFKELVESGVDGIILTAGNPKDLTPLIDEAEEKGLHVVCVSTDAPESRRSSIVCVEPYLNGCLAGELMGKFLPPDSKVAVVAGMLSAEDHRKKTDGFSEGFLRHCPGGKILSVIEGHEDEHESFQKTSDLLRRSPMLGGIYVNTVNCLPVCLALVTQGFEGKVKLITTDLFAEMAPYFQKGIITASIYQHPYRQGQIAMRLAADYLTHKAHVAPVVHLSPGVVMSSNLHLFREMRLTDAKPSEPVLEGRGVMQI
jgi:LacI family transcriptional regulator